ncbi:LysE type translocator [Thiorhodovibrio winogradskyi]|uniref:LysE type translocator n=1 Tax=Thiorhodovibrio winogradskyi TaxID=77007 RepID=A0ABZ0S3U1_9GAMM|nr:LysE family transporter [Thiorhodovibrio winogradskyi]
MTEFFILGLVLGLAAGVAPGPLLTLVLAEALRHGTAAGVRVALAPLITDLPLVLASWLLLRQWADSDAVLGALSLVGSLLVFGFGLQTLRAPAQLPNPKAVPVAPHSLRKGLLANVFSPHPYLFWLGVGGPILTRAGETGALAPAAFLLSFYGLLVGTKVLIAMLMGRTRGYLNQRAYRTVLVVLGLALCALALGLARDGLRLLGW